MANEDDFDTLALPVMEVTVQEDRSLIRRQGVLPLRPGRNRIRIPGVSPILVDKSISAQAADRDDESAIEILGARIVRRRITKSSQQPEAVAELEARRRALEASQMALLYRIESLDAERKALRKLLGTSVDELVEDSGWGHVQTEAGGAALNAVQQRILAVGQEHCEAKSEQNELERKVAELRRLEAAADTLQAHATASLELEIDRGGPWEGARPFEIRVDYLVPGALWRPWHRAQLIEDDGPARVRLQCEACVWQATGEDWTDARMVFSTERPSLGLKPPTLETDRLALKKKSANVDVQTRQAQIHRAGLGADASVEHADDLPGIDDGGDPQRLVGRVRSTIMGDGRPHRVPLFEFETEADVGLLCMPELAAAVITRSEQVNAAKHPLLAGPVDLVRGSGLVGATSLLYIAPGERFELGWGPDAALRVQRDVMEQEHERKTLSSWTRKPRLVQIKLSNLDGAPRDLVVRERIAVSEIDKVEVELRRAEPPSTADGDGIVEWDVHLQGLGQHTLTLEWVLVVHDDVQGL
ncbi:MAG: mucoidy inhibitor MuiA family protein [Myxococcota bacterium]